MSTVEGWKARRDRGRGVNLPQTIMTVSYTVGYFTVLIGLLKGSLVIPDNHEGTMTTILGGLTIAQGVILSYWFGSGPKEHENK